MMESDENTAMEGKWIRFEEGPPAPKTSRWFVVNKGTQETIGMVSWFGRWRRYAFSPEPNIVLEHQCLMDIADFCVDQTKARALNARAARELVAAGV